MTDTILRVANLRVYYETPVGPVKAVDGVSFDLKAGERFGLVGESGSGKSTTALAIMRLLKSPARLAGGTVHLKDQLLSELSDEEMRRVRLAQIALVPQGAMNSLNPVMRIQDQILDGVRAHTDPTLSRAVAERLPDLLSTVGLPAHVLRLYPHELSGGMKQRVCIAIGISLRPKVIVADEPTSALDVVVQRQIMQTLASVQKNLNAAVLLVGHDMGLMAQFVDRIGVMYGGKLVEIGPVADVFREPLHPYTQLLIASLPSLKTKGVFRGIPGTPPSLLSPPGGCVFHPRCPKILDECPVVIPELREIRPGRWVSCHLYQPAVEAVTSVRSNSNGRTATLSAPDRR
ncbi:MAG TPA: ABC transporter ATP-binding protein [Chloroflexota bacterium]|nr:ABC transporter ATP-binding protein [Chloroflexota bacterium]